MRVSLYWAFSACVFLSLSCASAGQIIAGQARVGDGDTLTINHQKIRLFGIDAPENSQSCLDKHGISWSCGAAAKAHLVGYINGQNVSCSITGQDTYQRYLGICSSGSINLNARLVHDGYVLAYRRYSKAFVPQEEQARRKKLGLWQGRFTAPWAWRKGQRLSKSLQNSSADCLIKGNINSKGDRIYHTPSSPWYSKTKITPSKGERWFCSEQEAMTAGWRAPR